MTETTLYRERVLAEIDTLPDEFLPFVLNWRIPCARASRSNRQPQAFAKAGPRRGKA
ncbi:MAG: hypothetical protein NTX45_12750 [Proteobacteria bacterium]|nr:hypothetical protein [Pseudomonadota bacterium]